MKKYMRFILVSILILILSILFSIVIASFIDSFSREMLMVAAISLLITVIIICTMILVGKMNELIYKDKIEK